MFLEEEVVNCYFIEAIISNSLYNKKYISIIQGEYYFVRSLIQPIETFYHENLLTSACPPKVRFLIPVEKWKRRHD